MTGSYLNQLRLISPELVLAVSAMLMLWVATLEAEVQRRFAPWLSLLACGLTLTAVLAYPWNLGLEALRIPWATTAFGGMFVLDAFSVFFKVIFLVSAILSASSRSRMACPRTLSGPW